MLRSAHTDPGGAELASVLDCFRSRWLRWARHRYPSLDSQHEDAVQEARMRVLEHIDQLRHPERVDAWVNSVFLSVLRDLLKKQRRRARWDLVKGRDDDPDAFLNKLPSSTTTTPEDEASHRERLEIVRRIARVDEVAWLRFEEGLSEKEIEERTGFGRDAVASRTKRIRKVLRRILAETDAEGTPVSTARLLDGTGLSREVRAKLTDVVDRLRSLSRRDATDEAD